MCELVLDSSAIVAIFKREPGCEEIERRIDRADAILIGAPTVLETVLILTGQTRRDQRAVVEAYLHRIDAEVVEFSEAHYFAAADAFLRFGKGFNAKANLNFGDCDGIRRRCRSFGPAAVCRSGLHPYRYRSGVIAPALTPSDPVERSRAQSHLILRRSIAELANFQKARFLCGQSQNNFPARSRGRHTSAAAPDAKQVLQAYPF